MFKRLKSFRSISVVSALLAAALLLNGCVVAPVMPPRGVLYTDQYAPLFSGQKSGTKEGRSSAFSILFLVAVGDASLTAALRNGGIEEIRYTDYRVENYLLVFQRYTTIVRGE